MHEPEPEPGLSTVGAEIRSAEDGAAAAAPAGEPEESEAVMAGRLRAAKLEEQRAEQRAQMAARARELLPLPLDLDTSRSTGMHGASRYTPSPTPSTESALSNLSTGSEGSDYLSSEGSDYLYGDSPLAAEARRASRRRAMAGWEEQYFESCQEEGRFSFLTSCPVGVVCIICLLSAVIVFSFALSDLDTLSGSIEGRCELPSSLRVQRGNRYCTCELDDYYEPLMMCTQHYVASSFTSLEPFAGPGEPPNPGRQASQGGGVWVLGREAALLRTRGTAAGVQLHAHLPGAFAERDDRRGPVRGLARARGAAGGRRRAVLDAAARPGHSVESLRRAGGRRWPDLRGHQEPGEGLRLLHRDHHRGVAVLHLQVPLDAHAAPGPTLRATTRQSNRAAPAWASGGERQGSRAGAGAGAGAREARARRDSEAGAPGRESALTSEGGAKTARALPHERSKRPGS